MRKTRPRRIRHSRRYPFGTIILLLLATYVCAMMFWPISAVQATVIAKQQVHTNATPTIVWPTYGQSAIGTSDMGVFASSGDQVSAPMASITKIVTALTVLQNKPLAANQPGPTITFTAEDAARYNQYFIAGGSIAKADAGMQISQYQLIQGMLIQSANNYADALAIWAYGSMDNFLTAANIYLTKHHLTHTVLADASGFSPDSKSSASDLVTIGGLALKQPVIADIVSQQTATIPSVGTLHNTNLLLGSDGVVGIKTGTTDEAGSCLLFAAQYTIGNTPVTLIGATLGGPSHPALARDITKLLDSTKSSFQEVTFAKLDQAFATYKTPWGSEAHAVANKNTSAVVWPGASASKKVSVSPIKPGSNPRTLGNMYTNLGSQTYTTELVLDKPLEKPGLLWRLSHPLEILTQ